MAEETIVNFWPGHPLSYATTRIDAFYNQQHLGSATGFILHIGPLYSLVTNWHVVSGLHPGTGACISKMGGIPQQDFFSRGCFHTERRGE